MRKTLTPEPVRLFRDYFSSKAQIDPKQWEGGRGLIVSLPPDKASPENGKDILEGLTSPKKWISPRHFYDTHGSALFEKICELPEYYLTRTEKSLLERHAQKITSILGTENSILEFGCGNCTKDHALFEAWTRQSDAPHFIPVDCCSSMLAQTIPVLLKTYPLLWTTALHTTYEQLFEHTPFSSIPLNILFLGSNIGNLSPQERTSFLCRIAQMIKPGGLFLFGADLQKDKQTLEAAYNDAVGVTAEFNLNLLTRLNREFGFNFVPQNFRHHAFYNDKDHRIEMHLESRTPQTVKHNGEVIFFEKGETIHTENSYKFSIPDLKSELKACGLEAVEVLTDEKMYFSVWLAKGT